MESGILVKTVCYQFGSVLSVGCQREVANDNRCVHHLALPSLTALSNGLDERIDKICL